MVLINREAPAVGVRSTAKGGFTLIELMIVVVIIGVLAGIAYPSYRNHVIKANRSAAQSFMLDVANREKQYLLDARQYVATTDHATLLANLSIGVPNEVSRFYTITVAAPAGPPPGFTVTATPQPGAMQAPDGPLTLDDLGTKTPSSKW